MVLQMAPFTIKIIIKNSHNYLVYINYMQISTAQYHNDQWYYNGIACVRVFIYYIGNVNQGFAPSNRLKSYVQIRKFHILKLFA